MLQFLPPLIPWHHLDPKGRNTNQSWAFHHDPCTMYLKNVPAYVNVANHLPLHYFCNLWYMLAVVTNVKGGRQLWEIWSMLSPPYCAIKHVPLVIKRGIPIAGIVCGITALQFNHNELLTTLNSDWFKGRHLASQPISDIRCQHWL